MSPTPHLSNVNSNPNAVKSSNSTASIFLGGVRRSWMVDTSNFLSSSSTSAPLSDLSATVTVAAADSADRTRPQGMRRPSLRVLPPSQPAENAPSVTVVSSQSPPQANVMSPAIAGRAQQQSQQQPASPPQHSLESDPPSKAPAPTISNVNHESVSLPPLNSIVSPPLSHGSPINIVNQNGVAPSHATLPSPRTGGSTPLPNPPQVGTVMSTASPARTERSSVAPRTPVMPTHRREGSGVLQSLQRRDSSHSNSPALTSAPPVSVGSPARQWILHSNAPEPSPINPHLDAVFFSQSLKLLDKFIATLAEKNCLGNVEQPRLQLLYQACAERDPLFLAVHQVYCLYSLAPQEFFQLPGFSDRQAHGLDVIKRLLVENNRVSPEFLRWSAHFPALLGDMMKKPAYRQAVEQARQCLASLADRWHPYVQQVRSREFPPLIQELVTNFGITSGALAYTIFLSTCRTLPGSKMEEHLKSVWQKDLRFYQGRCASTRPVSQARIQEETQKVIKAYRSVSLPAGATQARQPPLAHGPMEPTPVAVGRGGIHASRLANTSTRQMPDLQVSIPATRHMSISTAPLPTHSLPSPNLVVDRTQSAPIAHIMNAQSSSPSANYPTVATTCVPTNASNIHPVSMPVTHHRRSSWANGAPGPQYPRPPPLSELMSRSTGASTQAALPPGTYPSQIAQPVLESRGSPLVLSSTPSQRLVGRRPSQPQMRANGEGQPSQTVNSRHYAQAPQSLFPQQPHPSVPPTLLLPPPGTTIPANTAQPQPLRIALHQAHLRDPYHHLVSRGPAGDTQIELFQYLGSFAVPPTPLGKVESAFHWTFNLSKADRDRFPRVESQGEGQRTVRFYVDGSQVYRLRCIRVPSPTSEVAEQDWSSAESVWPGVFYVFVNNTELFVRRRAQHGKDFPLDITNHLREGENTISLYLIRSPEETGATLFSMAVEVLEVSDLARTSSLAQPLSAAVSRERINKRVSAGNQDPDVSVVSDHLSVNLLDPFTARIFTRPARGRSCEHQDCFDHMTWIQTRASRSGKRSLKNDWRCPICGRDARPQHLVIDGFLQEVHEELRRTNRLEGARAILIKADGSWDVKTDVDARESSERGADNTSTRVPHKRKANDHSNPSPAPQRPKYERPTPVMGVRDMHPPEVIALD
ncbi:hypothetical protein BDV25DRAFT_167571 [Aspergillus avenaceus]|uniref:SP-RING-type domain-containing protein n=1 Tax=Aspergillus avenaceus TaxID=36643 RepID=A0A5N6TCX6_ASPAV|nr:hypothetical protein BDV25DRAFT_167571 [Aspergillus avenaceus]